MTNKNSYLEGSENLNPGSRSNEIIIRIGKTKSYKRFRNSEPWIS
jgi:hypothetical protein